MQGIFTNGRSSPSRTSVALLCDYREEGWRSMDLFAEMLHSGLVANFSHRLNVRMLQPNFRRRLSRADSPRTNRWSFNGDRLLARFWDYPIWLRGKLANSDVFHVVDQSYAHLVHVLPAERTVVTCHDLDAFRCLFDPRSDPRPSWMRLMARRIFSGLRKASHVLCVSNAVRDEILRWRLLPESRLTVAHPGRSENFTARPDPIGDRAVERLLPQQPPGTPLLLNVSTTAPRKRLDILLEVFARVVEATPQARLVRVGGAFNAAQQAQVERLGLGDSISVMPFLDEPTLAALYRRCTVLLMPSEREGFGLPVVEAAACGLPAVASDLPVLRETAGPVAIFRPVGDVPAWVEGVLTALHEQAARPDQWRCRSIQAIDHARKFSWAETTARSVAIYDRLLKETERGLASQRQAA